MAVKNSGAGMVALNGATSTGFQPGASFDVQGCDTFSMQVTFTGGEPTVVVELQATLDPPTISDADATWYTIATFSTSDSDTSGEIITVTGTPVRRIACNLQTLSGGTSPTVTAKLAAT